MKKTMLEGRGVRGGCGDGWLGGGKPDAFVSGG